MSGKEIRSPILALVLISLGGCLYHARVHAVSFDAQSPANPANFVPFVFGLLSVIIAPLLLNFKRTVIVGYLLNGMSVIVGTLTMATLSLSHPPSPLTFPSIFLGTMLPSILLLFPKLFLGQTVLLHFYPQGLGRMFTPAWWTKHFCYLGIVFTLGHFIWR
jgi:hypothetical protein